MNEEEKKAIKWLKELYDIEKDFNSSTGKEESNIIKTLLNLIEKQQKEIEQLANGIRVLGTNPDITTEEIIKEFTENPITEEYMEEFKSRYISKDKIREFANALIDSKYWGNDDYIQGKNEESEEIGKELLELLEGQNYE